MSALWERFEARLPERIKMIGMARDDIAPVLAAFLREECERCAHVCESRALSLRVMEANEANKCAAAIRMTYGEDPVARRMYLISEKGGKYGLNVGVRPEPRLSVLLRFAEECAEADCTYGDGCPAFGSRHGQCYGCKAREALAAALSPPPPPSSSP